MAVVPLPSSEPDVVAVTGLNSFLGEGLVRRLLDRGCAVVGVDLGCPQSLRERIRFHRIDLAEPSAQVQLADVLSEDGAQTLVHTAFCSEPSSDAQRDHELDVAGSLHVLGAVAAAKLPRLVVPSSTMVYGPRPDHPAYIDEGTPLRGHPDAHAVRDRIELEQELARFRAARPETELSVLRACWVLGPSQGGLAGRYLSLPVVPVPMGYDPLLQLLHEEDWLHAVEAATIASHPGVFNVVAPGVLPLSTLLRLSGQRSLPLPSALLDRLAYLPAQSRTGDPPAAFFDYLRHSWVADGRRGWEAFGEPSYSTRETWMSFVSARRMRRYR